MSRLVVVSNRLPVGRPTGSGGELELPAGGLVSALLGALELWPRSLWVGWDRRAEPGATLRSRARGVALLGLGLDRAEVRDYYNGFCNRALWPLLHCFPGRLELDPRHVETYFAVQERFADVVAQELRPGDAVWVHDYHLLGLAAALRARGVEAPLGFFLHTPFPPDDLWAILPRSARLLASLLDFDLVGFHTRRDLENYLQACRRELAAQVDGDRLLGGRRRQRLGVYPVGIEPEDFAPPAPPRRQRRGRLARLALGRRVLLGVDRLDYTKGLVERCRAFELFLRSYPAWQQRVCLVQIASPSRSDLGSYAAERQALEKTVGHVNGELARLDWVPIHYLHRSFSRADLARFYRDADVALVTPLRDGMNLVAKEFVAAQPEEDPGVLVLSRFAGAAERLRDAVLVNPYAASESADAILAALEMPLEERRRRHGRLLAAVRAETASAWARGFVRELVGSDSGGEIR